MANQHTGLLTPEQSAYVKSKFGQATLAELANELGCSRGVVAGHWRIHRKHNNLPQLVRRPPSRIGSGKPRRPRRCPQQRVIGPNGKPLPLFPHAPSYGPPVTFDELDKLPLGESEICMCRHYVGNPDDTLFCGRLSLPGRPYCEEHTMIAYRAGRASPRTHRTKVKRTAEMFLEWRRWAIEMRSAA